MLKKAAIFSLSIKQLLKQYLKIHYLWIFIHLISLKPFLLLGGVRIMFVNNIDMKKGTF